MFLTPSSFVVIKVKKSVVYDQVISKNRNAGKSVGFNCFNITVLYKFVCPFDCLSYTIDFLISLAAGDKLLHKAPFTFDPGFMFRLKRTDLNMTVNYRLDYNFFCPLVHHFTKNCRSYSKYFSPAV